MMDPELPEGQGESEEVGEETQPMSLGAALAVLLAAVLAISAGIYFGVAQTVAGLFVILGIPVVLLWFVWNVFLRRLWRIRRMRGAQERRELMEAAMRDKGQTTKAVKEHED